MNYLLALFSGLLLSIGFPPLPLGFLAFIGFIPLLIALERARKKTITFALSYCCFFIFHTASNWWISSWQKDTDPYLMAAGLALCFIHPFFFTIPLIGYDYIAKKLGRYAALYSLPILWTSFEWLHSLGELSYPWQALGYTQMYYTPFVQMADITGVWGISFCIVCGNVMFALFWFQWQENGANEKPLVRLTRIILQSRLRVIFLCCLVFFPLVYGLLRLAEYRHEELITTSSLHVGIIQPNINPWGKWQGNAQQQVEHQMLLQDSLRRSQGSLDLAVWSETSIPYRILAPSNYYYWQKLRRWVDTSHTALLSGLPTDTVYGSSANAPPAARPLARGFPYHDTIYYDTFNSAMLLMPDSTNNSSLWVMPQLYRKMKLTPLAERVPYAGVFSFAIRWLTWSVGISGWGIGPRQSVLHFTGHGQNSARIGSIICIESIYPDFVAGFVRSGATMLTVITNDGWYDGTPGPEQHYQIAAMRAIETRRYVARCANTGISGIIQPDGTDLCRLQPRIPAAISAQIPQLHTTTLYVQWGDWLPIACTLMSIFVIILAIIQPKSMLFLLDGK